MTKYRFDQIAINSTEKKKPVESDRFTYLGLEHLDSGSLKVTRFGSETAPIGEKLVMHKGDVLFGKRRAYQKKVAIAPFDGIFSAHGMVLRPKEEVVDKAFFPIFISSDYFLDAAIKISVGSLSPTINWRDLKELEFELPDLATQRKLAELLWSINNTLEKYKQLISATDDLVKSQFIEMFGNISSGKYKYPTKKLGDVADVKSSHRIFTKEFVDSGVPFYRGTEIGQLAKGQIPTDLYYISNERYKEIASDDSKPQKGDLLMPSICDKGQVWLVDTDEPFYYKDGRVLCISPNRSTCNSKFLQYFMKQKTEIEYPKLGPGSTFAEFKIFLLKDMDILIPPITEQQNFASFVEQSDKSKFELKKALSELTATYKRIIKENIG